MAQTTRKTDPEKSSTLIPPQQIGTETGASHEVQLSSRTAALELFKVAKRRLLNVNAWHEYAGKAGGTFELCCTDGTPLHREVASIGDLIKIDLPGPGTRAGDGFDWVVIDAIEDKSNPMAEEESFSLRTRPVKNPLSSDETPAHFYTSETTSTFLVERKGDTLIASEVGRNEKINLDVPKITDKVRNALLATAARAGVSSLQWKALMMGILKEDE